MKRGLDRGQPSVIKLNKLDVVELAADVGRWPAGTVATVVELLPAGALVEISDDRGHSEDFLVLPCDMLRIVGVHQQERLAIDRPD